MKEENNLEVINYIFTRDVLAKAVLKNPSLFYSRYIQTGYDVFLKAIKSAWCKTCKEIDDSFLTLSEYEILVENVHIYENGDIFILVSLPLTASGCDFFGLYISDGILEMSDKNSDVDIKLFIFYRGIKNQRYILLNIRNDFSINYCGYTAGSFDMLVEKVYQCSIN